MLSMEATTDPREQLWDVSFDTYYDAFFEELLADALINKWGRLDDFTKIIVAITASGSAISGWALWGSPGWKGVWLACSGLAALLSVVHTALAVPGRIKAHADDKRRFAQLRTGLETFRYRLQVEQFDADMFNKEFVGLRRVYGDDIGLLNNDTFRTRGFEEKIQKQLNEQVADQTVGIGG
jgi:hypothetical protein